MPAAPFRTSSSDFRRFYLAGAAQKTLHGADILLTNQRKCHILDPLHHLFPYFSEGHKIVNIKDREFILNYIQKDRWAARLLKYVSAELRGDPSFMLKACEANPLSFKFASALLSDREFIRSAARKSVWLIKFIDQELKDDPDFWRFFIPSIEPGEEKDIYRCLPASIRTAEFLESLVRINPFYLTLSPENLIRDYEWLGGSALGVRNARIRHG